MRLLLFSFRGNSHLIVIIHPETVEKRIIILKGKKKRENQWKEGRYDGYVQESTRTNTSSGRGYLSLEISEYLRCIS